MVVNQTVTYGMFILFVQGHIVLSELIDVECKMEKIIRSRTSEFRRLKKIHIASAGTFQITIADNRFEYLMKFFETVHAQVIRRSDVTSGSIVLKVQYCRFVSKSYSNNVIDFKSKQVQIIPNEYYEIETGSWSTFSCCIDRNNLESN